MIILITAHERLVSLLYMMQHIDVNETDGSPAPSDPPSDMTSYTNNIRTYLLVTKWPKLLPDMLN
jgi:hypothetical protein